MGGQKLYIPVIDALEGLFAGQQDVGQWQADVHSTLTLSDTLLLKLTHLYWVCWNHHLKQSGRRGEARTSRSAQDC